MTDPISPSPLISPDKVRVLFILALKHHEIVNVLRTLQS